MFLDQVWDGIKTGSLACLCAFGIYCMVVGAITTVDQLATHPTAGCEKGGQQAIGLIGDTAVGRKSVEEGKPDRIADLLDEAADAIETLACNTKEKRHDKT